MEGAIQSEGGIKRIVLCLDSPNEDTRQKILRLMSLVCLMPKGHSVIMDAFNNFKAKKKEKGRFETLLKFLSEATSLDQKV